MFPSLVAGRRTLASALLALALSAAESLTVLAAGPAVDPGTADLRGVAMNNTGSGRTEVHILSQASSYQQFIDQVATPLEATTPDKWAFAWAYNGDLIGVAMNNTGSGRTEVHVLSAASNYQQSVLGVAIGIGPTTPTDWTFDVTPNRDLAAVHLRNTPSGQVEVYLFTAASNYYQQSFHNVTALPAVDPNQWEFRFLPSGDLVAIRLNGGLSFRTEVHILSAASWYQQFSNHVAINLEPTTHAGWEFQVAHNGDLLAIKLNNTGSGRTEVHRLSAASDYQSFTLQTATALAPVFPSTWNFGVGSLIAPTS